MMMPVIVLSFSTSGVPINLGAYHEGLQQLRVLRLWQLIAGAYQEAGSVAAGHHRAHCRHCMPCQSRSLHERKMLSTVSYAQVKHLVV